MVCNLMSAGCQSVSRGDLTPSPDGSVIASIDGVVFDIMGPEPIHIYRGAYLRILRIKQSREPGFTSMQIADKSEYVNRHGGFYWSPDGRKVAFTTYPEPLGPEARRLWIIDIYAKPKKNLIAENVYSFRWVDDTHIVYVTQDGDVIQATLLDDGIVSEEKTLFSVGHPVENLRGEYKYTVYCSRYEFDNPLSPHADYFVYGNGRDLTIVNLSASTIAKSFQLIGMPIQFWWDDAGRDCVIGVEASDKWTYHYYLYQSEEGTLKKLSGDIKGKFSGESGESGRVWASSGKQFMLKLKYKTWLFDTNSWCAVWMENEIKKIKDGDLSPLTMTPLPLEAEERDKVTTENTPFRVDITPSPRKDLLLVHLLEGEWRTPKYPSTCYVLKIIPGPKGEISLDILKKIESGRKESFLWMDFWVPECIFWTADGRGLLFTNLWGDKFRFVSIP